MKHIRFLVLAISLLAGVMASVAAPVVVSAASPQSVVCNTLGSAGCSTTPANGVNLNSAIAAAVNILSMVVGIIAVIMIIISGIKFITANGDAGAVKSARHTLTYALVGVVVVAVAQALVKFVLRRVTQ
jgi:type IV secretion system pilin